MASLSSRRSVMTLFSAPDCADSHRVRIVLAEKDITVDILNINPDNKPEDLAELTLTIRHQRYLTVIWCCMMRVSSWNIWMSVSHTRP